MYLDEVKEKKERFKSRIIGMLAGAGNAWGLDQLFSSEKYSNRGKLRGYPVVLDVRTLKICATDQSWEYNTMWIEICLSA